MGKKNKMNWKRNLPFSTDKSVLNTAHWFTPEDFEHNLPVWYCELCCDFLNRLRIEYISLRNNGQPKSSYKIEVYEKINKRKEERLSRKLMKAEKFMRYNGMKLREDFDPKAENRKPKFEYNEEQA